MYSKGENSNKKNVEEKNAHFDLNTRCLIATHVGTGISLQELAKLVGKDPTAISREIKRNRIIYPARDNYGLSLEICKYTCKNYEVCRIKNNCPRLNCDRQCRTCKNKSDSFVCEYYNPITCKRLNRFPSVCNGCPHFKSCRLERAIYDPKKADDKYHKHLVESRNHLHVSKQQLEEMDMLLKDGTNRKLSVQTIVNEFPEVFCYSVPHIYKLVGDNTFTSKRMDLIRTTNRKKTSKKGKNPNTRTNISKEYLPGRTYSDFVSWKAIHGTSTNYVEIDTVEGLKSDHTYLMTLIIPSIQFILIYVLNGQNQEETLKVMKLIQSQLDYSNYVQMFKAILGDRGKEFTSPLTFEAYHETGEIVTNYFYTDPQSPHQKGSLERKHTELRYIVPKGSSLDQYELTQEDCDLMASHINSSTRFNLGGKSPYELFVGKFGVEFANQLKVTKIEYGDLNLTPSLIIKKRK